MLKSEDFRILPAAMASRYTGTEIKTPACQRDLEQRRLWTVGDDSTVRGLLEEPEMLKLPNFVFDSGPLEILKVPAHGGRRWSERIDVEPAASFSTDVLLSAMHTDYHPVVREMVLKLCSTLEEAMAAYNQRCSDPDAVTKEINGEQFASRSTTAAARAWSTGTLWQHL